MSESRVTIRDLGPQGMITLRGDLSNAKLRAACKALTGVSVPDQGAVAGRPESGLCWMSPDEVLVLLPKGSVAEACARLSSELAGTHHLAVDVSDARAMFEVAGPFAREVIAKLAPVDMHPDSLPPGRIIRSRLGQVAAAFWVAEDGTIRVLCFRSMAGYVTRLLQASAQAGPVGVLPSG